MRVGAWRVMLNSDAEHSTTEHLPDDASHDDLRLRSAILSSTQTDFDRFDEFVEEFNIWGHPLPFLPSDATPDDAPQVTIEVSQSMGSERSITSNVSPTTENLPNKTPQDDFRPLTPMPTILQADFNLFDLLIEGWYGSRPRFQLPHWSDGWGDLGHNRLGGLILYRSISMDLKRVIGQLVAAWFRGSFGTWEISIEQGENEISRIRL